MASLIKHKNTHTFLSTFATVALLGFQSQAVIHGHYGITAFTSFAIAFAQYVMIRRASADGWIAAFYMGLGGATGILTAMVTFRNTLGAPL